MVKPGVYSGMGMEAYHDWKLDKDSLIDGPISCSMLKAFDSNPYAWSISADFKRTEAMRTGSLFDAALTDPESMNDESLFKGRPSFDDAVVLPFDSLRTNAAKAWKASMEAEGHRVISQKDKDAEMIALNDWRMTVSSEKERALKAADIVREHPIAGEIMQGAEFQVGIIGEIGGIPAKCLLDILPRPDGEWPETIFDYKTTSMGIDDDSIRKSIGQFKYHWQAAFYRTMFNKFHTDRVCDQFGFIFQCVKTLEVRVVTLHEDDLILGGRAIRNALKKFAKCAHNGIESQYLKSVPDVKLMPYHAMSEDEKLTLIEAGEEEAR